MADADALWPQRRGDERLAQDSGGGEAGNNVVNMEGGMARLDG